MNQNGRVTGHYIVRVVGVDGEVVHRLVAGERGDGGDGGEGWCAVGGGSSRGGAEGVSGLEVGCFGPAARGVVPEGMVLWGVDGVGGGVGVSDDHISEVGVVVEV